MLLTMRAALAIIVSVPFNIGTHARALGLERDRCRWQRKKAREGVAVEILRSAASKEFQAPQTGRAKQEAVLSKSNTLSYFGV